MFEQKSLNKIDGDYFNIIIADSQDVTIQSRNTGHYWYLHCAGYPTEEALVIPFDQMPFATSLRQHNPESAELFGSLSADNRKHEFVARYMLSNMSTNAVLGCAVSLYGKRKSKSLGT